VPVAPMPRPTPGRAAPPALIPMAEE